MTRTTLRAVVVAAAFGAATVTVTVSPALAEDPPPTVCDAATLSATVDSAAVAEDAARKEFTGWTSSSMRALGRKYKLQQAGEARAAKAEVKDAARAFHTATPEGRAAALTQLRAARAEARTEAKQARQARQASHAQLVSLVKAHRAELKTAWDDAKNALESARTALETCEAQTTTTPDPGAGVTP